MNTILLIKSVFAIIVFLFTGNSWNPSTSFINFFAKIGWAYDLKSVSKQMIARRAQRSGDGSHIWGYGDADIEPEDLQELDKMNLEKEL